jgi:hypothetical protein
MIGLLVGLIIFCIVAGLAWWVINQFPMPQPVRVAVTVVFVLICLLILLNYVPFSLPRGRLG